MRIQQIRIDMFQLRARAALAVASQSAGVGPFLSIAEGQARQIESERAPWATGHVAFIRAGIALARGDETGAIELLSAAEWAYESSEMHSYAAATRRRRGELIGGDEGQHLVSRANAWMLSQDIRNPARMTAMYAPGFPDRD
jgi:hypothetical protein